MAAGPIETVGVEAGPIGVHIGSSGGDERAHRVGCGSNGGLGVGTETV